MTRRRLSVALVVLVLLGAVPATAQKETENLHIEVARQLAAELPTLRQQAEQGDAFAQYNLGILYENGESVPKDFTEAVRWYRLAAEGGNAAAQYHLGLMHKVGYFEVPEDPVEFFRWVRLAAEQGHINAMSVLEMHYFVGDGVPQDYVEAHKWANLGASRTTGDLRSYFVGSRNRVEERMTPAQVGEAQTLAREWQAAFDAR